MTKTSQVVGVNDNGINALTTSSPTDTAMSTSTNSSSNSNSTSAIMSTIGSSNRTSYNDQETRNNLNATTFSSNQNHLAPSHSRTHSHPLTLLGCVKVSNQDDTGRTTTGASDLLPSSSSLTDILNLDFVNIPSPSDNINNNDGMNCDPDSITLTLDLGHSQSKSNSNCSTGSNSNRFFPTPGEIPPSAMLKYLTDKRGSDSSSNGNNNEVLEDILVDLGTVHSTSEIAKVLDNFNSILERIEREEGDLEHLEDSKFLNGSPAASSSSGGSSSRIKNSVEAFADLLLSGGGDEEDEDLLIIVDENDSDSLPHSKSNTNHRGLEQGQIFTTSEDELEQDEIDDLCPSLELEHMNDLELEGYESDRPMVRASMRKLRPVKLRPLPSTSTSNSEESRNHPPSAPPATPRSPSPSGLDPHHHHVGLANTGLNNSALTNKILVTSLMNSVLNNNNNSCEEHRQLAASLSSSSMGGNVSMSSIEGQCQVNSDGHAQIPLSCSSSHQNNTHSRNQSANSSQLLTIVMINNNEAVNNNPSTSVNNNEAHGLASGGSSNNGISTNGISSISISSDEASRSNSANSSPGGANLTQDPTFLSPNNATTTNTSNPISVTINNSSTNTASSATTTTNATGASATSAPTTGRRRRTGQSSTSGTGGVLRVPAGRWPHRLSSVLALIGCTLGLNNICRFALLSVQYGANFILQFVFLSFAFGIPLLTFHMSIGQYLSSGIIDMWKISPIFQGIGVGLMISQALVGLYTAVGVSWMFIYFRDSFVTRHDQYRWGKCVREFRECDPYQVVYGYNQTVELAETVPDYFNGVVLQRSSPDYPTTAYVPSSLKFTVAFNLAVVWMLVFVSLSKGLKSYGKVVHGFVLAPVAAIFVLAFKMVGLVDTGAILFGHTNWSEFFFNSQTWVVAAREAFFTWGLLGACVMQVTAHNRHSHPLKSDAVIVIMVTTVVLLLSAFIGNVCHSVMTASLPQQQQPQQYSYMPSSFESDRTYKFLAAKGFEIPDLKPYNYNHNPFLMGVRIMKPDFKQDHTVSGYQVLRLATELFPTTMAILSPGGLSPFWTVLFYFTLVLFGIAQQLAIWHCVINGIIAIKSKLLRSWETTITFFVCGVGYVLGLPLCTETGIFVNYFLDFAIGSGWWIMILYLLELVAVFIVRGAPYCGENIVTVLITGAGRIANILAPLVSFVWNVIMPVALLVLSIASFKSGNIRELYDWNPHRGYVFWPSWTREVGSLIQLLPILAVPFVAIVQSCRYLSNGPADLFDRMQQLYRPSTRFGNSSAHGAASDGTSSRNGGSSSRSEDPPPKYTPPPSYSTATGAKIARFLRNSFRRSIRRLSSPGGPSTSSSLADNLPPPPNYASVILEINAQRSMNISSCGNNNTSDANGTMVPPPEYDEATQLGSKSEVLGAEGGLDLSKVTSKGLYQIQLSQTLGRSLAEGSKERASLRRIASDITPRDIARMLRASFRRSNGPQPDIESQIYQQRQLDLESEGITFIASSYSNEQAGPSFTRVPPYTFSRNSLEKIDYDLDMFNELEAASPVQMSSFPYSVNSNVTNVNVDNTAAGSSSSSSSHFNGPFGLGGYGFDKSRNRYSNDSQLALISDGFYDLGGIENDIEIGTLPPSNSSNGGRGDLMTLGIVNSTFHLQNAQSSSSSGSLPSHSEA